MALPTGSASRSRDHFSAKFGLRRSVYMFGRNLRVVEGSVVKKRGGCAAIEFRIIKLTWILYYHSNLQLWFMIIWKFSSPGVCRFSTLAGSDITGLNSVCLLWKSRLKDLLRPILSRNFSGNTWTGGHRCEFDTDPNGILSEQQRAKDGTLAYMFTVRFHNYCP